jgi:hypothetical protein
MDQPGLSVHNAMEAGMLLCMDDEESLHFMLTEVLLNQHAQDHSWTVEELRSVIVLLKLCEFKAISSQLILMIIYTDKSQRQSMTR